MDQGPQLPQPPGQGPGVGHGCGSGPWKVELVPMFQGGEGTLDNSGRLWLDKLMRVAQRARWDEDTTLDVALIRMTGEAQVWADSLDFTSWQVFRDAFERRFCRTPPNALLLLNNCVQEAQESVAQYSDRFRQLCRRLRVEPNLPLLVTQYIQGLRQPLFVVVVVVTP